MAKSKMVDCALCGRRFQLRSLSPDMWQPERCCHCREPEPLTCAKCGAIFYRKNCKGNVSTHCVECRPAQRAARVKKWHRGPGRASAIKASREWKARYRKKHGWSHRRWNETRRLITKERLRPMFWLDLYDFGHTCDWPLLRGEGRETKHQWIGWKYRNKSVSEPTKRRAWERFVARMRRLKLWGESWRFIRAVIDAKLEPRSKIRKRCKKR